jgi:protein required for attachment to host cells
MVNGEKSVVTKHKHEKVGNFLLPNERTFVVAGDSAKARIFLTQRRFGAWAEVTTLTNPDARVRERESATDRPGRTFDSFGKGRHAMAQEETGQQTKLHRFANEVADYLNKGMTAGDFEHLVLIAEPTFLGFLRRELSAKSSKSVLYELPMNPTNHDVEKLKTLFT